MQQGQRIAGRYRLDRVVGSGGMGEVWRATDLELNRTVAVKRGTVDRSDLLREARIAAALQHPNVVTLYDSVTEGEHRWLVLEYVPSHSLSETLRAHGKLSPAAVAHVGAQIADAVAAVHAAGVVHRDIKPGNILIDQHGQAKLTDFGISRRVWSELTATESGLVAGTPGYLAPEVAQGHEPTAASDVFALGATLFAAVEGDPPFGRADNPLVLLRRAADGTVPAARSAGPLAPVLAQLLRRKAAERPDAATAQRMLAAVAAQLSGGTGTVASSNGSPKVARWQRHRTPVAAAAVAVLVIAAAVVLPNLGGTTVAGSPAPVGVSAGPQVPGAPLAPATTGDVHSADACGLLNEADFARFGTTQVDPAYGNFARCDVLINTKDDDLLANVQVALEDSHADEEDTHAPTQTMGKVRVQRPGVEDDTCHRTLVLPDASRILVQAGSGHHGSVDLCALAEIGVQTVVKRLNQGPVPRLAQPYPPNSLAWVDACSLLDSAALTQVAGIEPNNPDAGLGNWRCDWDTPSDTGNLVELKFDRGEPPSPDDGTPITLAGRPAFATQEDGDPNCEILLAYRTYATASGETKTEVVQVYVWGDDPVPKMCTEATSLATTVATRLPKA